MIDIKQETKLSLWLSCGIADCIASQQTI